MTLQQDGATYEFVTSHNPLGLPTPRPGIGKLVEALAKAQQEFLPIKKTKENPYFKSMYADLEDIISATQPALSKNGLVVFQLLETSVDGKYIGVRTRLAHTSGEFIESTLSMPIGPKNDHQAVGTAGTYGRRYGYQAIIGVAAEQDDDGNKNHVEEAPKEKKVKYTPKAGKTTQESNASNSGVPKAVIPPSVSVSEEDRFPTKEENKQIVEHCRVYTRKVLPELGFDNPPDVLLGYIEKKTGITDTKLLTVKTWKGILAELDKARAENRLKDLFIQEVLKFEAK